MSISSVMTLGSLACLAEHVAPASQPAVIPFLGRLFADLPHGARVLRNDTSGALISFEVGWGHGNDSTRDAMFRWAGDFWSGLRDAGIEWGGGG